MNRNDDKTSRLNEGLQIKTQHFQNSIFAIFFPIDKQQRELSSNELLSTPLGPSTLQEMLLPQPFFPSGIIPSSPNNVLLGHALPHVAVVACSSCPFQYSLKVSHKYLRKRRSPSLFQDDWSTNCQSWRHHHTSDPIWLCKDALLS